MSGGSRLNSGRKSIPEEREIREKLKEFIPNILEFYRSVFESNNLILKDRVSGKIMDKSLSDRRPDEEEILKRIEAIEGELARRDSL